MMRSVFLTVVYAFVALCFDMELSAADECKGCVQLDSHNFDKIIPKFKAAVVKFDVAFPYGEKHEEFGKIAAATKDAVDLIVGEVGVKDFGNKENSDLAKRYNIRKDDYPVILLFVQGKTEPYRFTAETDADFTADNIKRFIKKKTDIYLGLPGCVEKLDKLADEFKSANEKDRQAILNKAKVFEETLPEEHRPAAKVYVKMMEKIMDKGDVFVQTEQTRIDGLLKGKLSKEKKRNMEERRNILQSFTHRDEL
ncbi:endoplasmic reticulum resident protein 29 [Phymastichus coffea]|uniref:endoplasmic reticulum resident protein 29 n=1 Tax=Phymastichus coffea TaxID=108790 RepID=UPI00273AC02E|nr:endoplasmic reticulum resident protein 29 [Phymastichus coffea]XP_058790408.1 endoplasmic reticulum resident protein 29 [Phymastichus coffea]XP_058790409.1 endoplasmic reticulum resident protein 29 [Phymastichus coffea]